MNPPCRPHYTSNLFPTEPVLSVHIAVPCYNESGRLDRAEFLRLAQRPGWRLTFVDDGSTDGTARMLQELCAGRPNLSMLTLPVNRGKAEAVRQGLLRALNSGADLVGFIDADLSTPAPEVERLVAVAQAATAPVVMGARVQLLGTRIERHWYRHYFGRVFATAASMVLGLPVYDTQCGAKFFRPTPALRHALARPFLSRWIFDVELIGRLLAGSLDAPPLRPEDFLEVPLQVWRDVKGSKVSILDVPLVMVQLATVWLALLRWKRGT